MRTDGVSGSKADVITEEDLVHTVEYTNAPPSNPGGNPGGDPGNDPPPRDPKDPPSTPPNETEPPSDNPTDEPENPSENPAETPENPVNEPEPPSEEPANPPENPEAPSELPPEAGEYPTELPDPNDPNSPDEITIIGPNGVPLTYLKVWDPETEEWVYLPEDEIPLAPMDGTPQTGDEAQPVLWGALCAASLGAGWVLLPRNRKKRRIRRNRQKHQS